MEPAAERGRPEVSPAVLERAAVLCRAMGDAARLCILQLLLYGEARVTEIVDTIGEKFSTISQRLRVLRQEGLVSRRREGTQLFYSLADRHVADLLQNALAHASELDAPPGSQRANGPIHGEQTMTQHANHSHQHGPNCGHTAIKHDGHVDYLHDGHLHHVKARRLGRRACPGSRAPRTPPPASRSTMAASPRRTTSRSCLRPPAVPHGDHVDYLVEGHLHHPHGDHCDDHGPVQMA